MPGHDTNLIFFNKKNKDWTSKTLATPLPSTFCLTRTPSQSGRHMLSLLGSNQSKHLYSFPVCKTVFLENAVETF